MTEFEERLTHEFSTLAAHYAQEQQQLSDLPRRQQLTGIVTRESATFAWILRVHRRNEAGKTRLDGVSLCDVISPSETGSNPCPGRPAPRLIQTRREEDQNQGDVKEEDELLAHDADGAAQSADGVTVPSQLQDPKQPQ